MFLEPDLDAATSLERCRVMTPAIAKMVIMRNSGRAARTTASAIVPPVTKDQDWLSMAAPSREYKTRIPSSGVQMVIARSS